LETIHYREGKILQHDFNKELLILDVDLTLCQLLQKLKETLKDIPQIRETALAGNL